MPVHVRKLPNQNKYKVVDNAGRVFSKGTTKDKAIKQAVLLNTLHNKKLKRPRKVCPKGKKVCNCK
jgi:hypothetical protein